MARPMYRWFVALVWPDGAGVPTARIYHWDRNAGKLGSHVGTVQFDRSRGFRAVVGEFGYEVVEGQLKDSVTPDGVLIALRRELVPVPVPAYARARARA